MELREGRAGRFIRLGMPAGMPDAAGPKAVIAGGAGARTTALYGGATYWLEAGTVDASMPLRPVGTGFLISTLSDRYGSYCPNLKGCVTVRVMVACSMMNVSVCPQYTGKLLNLPLGKDTETPGPMTTDLPCTNAAARKQESGRHQ